MGNTQLGFISKTVAGAKTVNLGTYPCLYRFKGFPIQTDAETNISVGGKAVTVTHDAWHEYVVEQRSIPLSGHVLFSRITAWISHAQAGGEFSFTMDADEDEATTLSGAEAAGQTVLAITDTTGFSADEWVFMEDASDPTVFQRVCIETVDSGIQVTIKESLKHSFVTASVFRHAEYFPACVLIGKAVFEEREGGKGPNLYDLRFKFRTVR